MVIYSPTGCKFVHILCVDGMEVCFDGKFFINYNPEINHKHNHKHRFPFPKSKWNYDIFLDNIFGKCIPTSGVESALLER